VSRQQAWGGCEWDRVSSRAVPGAVAGCVSASSASPQSPSETSSSSARLLPCCCCCCCCFFFFFFSLAPGATPSPTTASVNNTRIIHHNTRIIHHNTQALLRTQEHRGSYVANRFAYQNHTGCLALGRVKIGRRPSFLYAPCSRWTGY